MMAGWVEPHEQGTEARKLLTEGASRRDARISALENSATDTTASTAALKKQMAQERDLRAASMTDFRDRVDAAVAQVQSLREQLLTTAVPEGGAVGMVALQENSEALLAEVQELLQDQLSIRDEALQILQQRVQQVRAPHMRMQCDLRSVICVARRMCGIQWWRHHEL